MINTLRKRIFNYAAFISLVGAVLFLSACASTQPIISDDKDNDVCIGEAVVVDPNQPIDLEAIANELECETDIE